MAVKKTEYERRVLELNFTDPDFHKKCEEILLDCNINNLINLCATDPKFRQALEEIYLSNT